MTGPLCRHCANALGAPVLDLGHAPPSNAYLDAEDLRAPEVTYPLRLRLCPECFLLQTEDFVAAERMFTGDYAYFSSISQGWLRHAADYCATIAPRLGLDGASLVVELASNDGYLLRNFVVAGIPCFGIEPAEGTARAAEALGIPTLREFFTEKVGRRLAAEGRTADLVIGNNVLAHVPDPNDFTRGIAALLAPDGVVTLEVPHLLELLRHNQFDTVYHEHFSYFSLRVVQRLFATAGLRVFDVERLATHGGSLRIYGCRDAAAHAGQPAVAALLQEEAEAGLIRHEVYDAMQARAVAAKHGLLRFLLDAHARGRSVAAYGAAAKGNTLLNFAGVRADLLAFVCDAATSKQGRFLPGSHIPILSPDALERQRPDDLLILPWNIAAELRVQLAPLTRAGTRLVTAIPEIAVL